MNISLDTAHPGKLSKLAERVHEGTLARSLLTSAIDATDPILRTS